MNQNQTKKMLMIPTTRFQIPNVKIQTKRMKNQNQNPNQKMMMGSGGGYAFVPFFVFRGAFRAPPCELLSQLSPFRLLLPCLPQAAFSSWKNETRHKLKNEVNIPTDSKAAGTSGMVGRSTGNFICCVHDGLLIYFA